MDFYFVWLITFVLGFWIFRKINQSRNLPPGPWGLPILGYLPFIDRHQPHLTLTKLSKTYGPIYGIGMGSIYAVVLSDHKLIRDAFAKDTFSGRAPLYLTHGIMHGNGKLDPHAFTNSLGNVVNEIIFGFKYPPEDKTWHWLRQIQEEGCHEMGVAGVVNFLPFVRHFSSSIRNIFEMLVRGQAQTHRLYASIIARRRKMLGFETPKGAEYPPHADLFDDHPDGHIKCIKYSKHASNTEEHFFDPNILIPMEDECILDNFLKEQKRRFENGEDSARFMTDEQLHYLLADMFGAGLDTTAVTLAWFLLYMALHPEEQELVRKEILDVYPEDGDVDGSRLPYLMAAICETQRIRSIVPVGIPHGCVQDTYIGKYRVPKGAMVIPLQWAIHMDPTVWKNPEEYKPSRFLAADGSLLKPQEFIPFQTGKRMCPGDELSRMLACSLVARLFRRRRIRLASDPPTAEQMQGTVGVTLAPPVVQYYCDAL
ncbi:hypothetical protein ABMA27_013901 [Loxostege sticticalis]|uniref:Cytochrome P450 306a1 n=1 Tax=Loxostege sticticalis TaxID=481309 RepID=A0ABR3IBX3_LOXSC